MLFLISLLLRFYAVLMKRTFVSWGCIATTMPSETSLNDLLFSQLMGFVSAQPALMYTPFYLCLGPHYSSMVRPGDECHKGPR